MNNGILPPWPIPSPSDIVNAALKGIGDALASGIASTAKFALGQLDSMLRTVTSINLMSGWFVGGRVAAVSSIFTQLAVTLIVVLVIIAGIDGVIHGDPGRGLRALLVDVPVSIFAMGVVGVGLTGLSMLVDEASKRLLDTGIPDLRSLITAGPAQGASGSFFSALILGVIVVSAVVVMIEMVLRVAAVYFMAMLIPLALAARVWPAARSVWHKLLEAMVVLVLSKVVIIGGLAFGLAIVTDPGASGALGSFGVRLVGMVILMGVGYAPRGMMRLVPKMELAVLSSSAMRAAPAAATSAALVAPSAISRLGGAGPSSTRSTQTTQTTTQPPDGGRSSPGPQPDVGVPRVDVNALRTADPVPAQPATATVPAPIPAVAVVAPQPAPHAVGDHTRAVTPPAPPVAPVASTDAVTPTVASFNPPPKGPRQL